MRILPAVVFIVIGIWIGSAYPEIGQMVLTNVKAGIAFVSQFLSSMKG
jgi:hypothetical protein